MLAAELYQGCDTATAMARQSAMRPTRTRATGTAIDGALIGRLSSCRPNTPAVAINSRRYEYEPFQGCLR